VPSKRSKIVIWGGQSVEHEDDDEAATGMAHLDDD
jgi:hypothetical protein